MGTTIELYEIRRWQSPHDLLGWWVDEGNLLGRMSADCMPDALRIDDMVSLELAARPEHGDIRSHALENAAAELAPNERIVLLAYPADVDKLRHLDCIRLATDALQ